jgi:ligand-binding sensor domain-containing protein
MDKQIVKRLSLIIGAFLLLADGLNPSSSHHPRRNDRYRPGDWVSYGVARYITSVAVGTQHAYFGSSEGILRYDIFRERWEPPLTTSDGLADNQIFAVAYDVSTGFLWCSTHQGLGRLNPSSLRWSNFSKSEIGISEQDEIVSIGVDQQSLWLETRSLRFFRLDKLGNVILPVDNQDIVDNDKTILWFGARAPRPKPLPHFFMPGGYLFDPAGAVQDFRLRRAMVTGFVRDNWNNLWFGTWGLGAWRANVYLERAELLPFGLAQRRVDALAFDERGLWVGGRNDRLDALDEDIRGITYWRNPSSGSTGAGDWEYHEARFNLDMSSDEVNRFTVDNGRVYCATEYGINIYEPKKNRWRRIVSNDGLADERVNDVLIYAGFLWAATDLGLNRIAVKTIGSDSLEITDVLPDQLRHIAIYDLERTDNLLWIGTERGPFIYDVTKATGGYLADNEGPRDERTLAISHVDSTIWLATDLGVEAFDVKNKVWLPAPARQRLPNSAINCLLARPEAVWVGTDAGVFKYNRKLKEWRQFTVEDGLLDNRVAAIAVKDDLIWFGTLSGLTVFRWKDAHRID